MNFLLITLFALYPLIFWFTQDLRLSTGVLFFGILIRVLKKPSLLWVSVLLFVAVIFCCNLPVLFKLYPVIVNMGLFGVFGFSLMKPPSVIERLARLQDPHLPPRGVIYTKRVTQIWCCFFILNAAIALYTAFFASLKVWSLYNGVIAYFLMATLFCVEFMVRQRVKRSLHA